MNNIMDMPIDQQEQHLLDAHDRNPKNLAVINELTYYYALVRPNKVMAEHYDVLFKNIVDSRIIIA